VHSMFIDFVSRQAFSQLVNFPTWDHKCLKCLSIPSLELRHLYTDLFWCYKIVFGLVDIKCDMFFLFLTCVNTCGHKFKLYKCHSSAGVHANYRRSDIQSYP